MTDHTSESETLLREFVTLANAKGAHFSRISRSQRGHILIHYRNGRQPLRFLNHVEALEHVYVAFNLQRQIPYEPLMRKRFQTQRPLKEEATQELEGVLDGRAAEPRGMRIAPRQKVMKYKFDFEAV